MNTRSIHFRLTVWHTVLMALAALCFGAYAYFGLQTRFYSEIEASLARRTVHLREDILPELVTGSPAALQRRIEEIYSPEQNDRFIRISAVDGAVLYRSGPPRDLAFDPAMVPLPNRAAPPPVDRPAVLQRSRQFLLVGMTATIDGKSYVIEMGTGTSPVDVALRRLLVELLVGLPVIVMVAGTGGWLLIRRALAPVIAMRDSAERISFGKLRQRLPAGGSGDTIDHLAETLNHMLDRLDGAYQQASRFSADASHELRTPLTILRGELESMLAEPALTAPQREAIGSILEEVERLSVIVESLFSLARLDAGAAKGDHSPVDLAALARTVLDQMRLLADDKHISVAVVASTPVMVMGDGARLKQVIVNLLDNAIKYTMPGGAIEIATSAAAGTARLVVRDNGIGIAPEALPHVFERFYRADRGGQRAAHSNVQGAGLGLSIVQAICQAHGGAVTARSNDGAGATLTVSLPMAES